MIYLDHAALTPTLPAVLAAMNEAAATTWGHPDARHAAGRRARARLEQARADVAAYLSCDTAEVAFASSGGQALGRAVALARAARPDGALAISRVEHPSFVRAVEATGAPIVWVPAPAGNVAPDDRALDVA